MADQAIQKQKTLICQLSEEEAVENIHRRDSADELDTENSQSWSHKHKRSMKTFVKDSYGCVNWR